MKTHKNLIIIYILIEKRRWAFNLPNTANFIIPNFHFYKGFSNNMTFNILAYMHYHPFIVNMRKTFTQLCLNFHDVFLQNLQMQRV